MERKQKNYGKLRGKLHGNRGETLVEMMASIGIASMSAALLFSALMAAARIDKRALKADEAYYQALSAAEAGKNIPEEEAQEPDGSGGPEEAVRTGTVKITGDGVSQKEVDILFYGGEGIYSYGPAKGNTEAGSPDDGDEEVLP